MRQSKIILEGAGQAACLTFRYERWPFLGEVSLEGSPVILDVLRKNLSLPQAIIRRDLYPAPPSKGYLHAFAAARVTANSLGLELSLIDEPSYPTLEELEEYNLRSTAEIESDAYSDETVAELLDFEFVLGPR